MNRSDLISYVNGLQLKGSIPEIRPGYVLTISERIIESKKTRVQKFQGMVIAINNRNSVSHNVLLRKKIDEFWVEKRFYLNSPLIEGISVDATSRPRRAKLYYLRNPKGLSERLKRLRGK